GRRPAPRRGDSGRRRRPQRSGPPLHAPRRPLTVGSPREPRTVEGLALKLVLTPALIGAVSLAGRRWGPGVSGWLVGVPPPSGPVAFFSALDHGGGVAAAGARG